MFGGRPMSNGPLKEIISECLRLEEDAVHSAKGHLNAEGLWGSVHLWIGIGIATSAALAGIGFFTTFPQFAGYLAFVAAVLSGVSTALNPEKLAASHGVAGRKYNSLKNDARIFRTIGTTEPDLPVVHAKFEALSNKRNDLNEASPGIPWIAYALAKRAIRKQENIYRVDEDGDEK